jgi:NADPH:quinone reductase-like Zn-dependent oxidoreductase
MTFVEAAAMPHAAMLAIQGLRDRGEIQPGQKLLINGAGGGVGTFGVQIAKSIGVEVTGVDSPGKLDTMRSVGFDHTIDYTQEDFTRNGQCYDLILDTKTDRSTFDYARALSPNGIYVTVGGSTARLFQALIMDLNYINELFEAGKIKPVIDGPFKLNEYLKPSGILEKANT